MKEWDGGGGVEHEWMGRCRDGVGRWGIMGVVGWWCGVWRKMGWEVEVLRWGVVRMGV